MKTKIILFIVFFMLLALPVGATLVKPINLEQLVGLSKYIVKAEVTEKQIANDEHESGGIVVYYTLAVKEWVKGTPPAGMEDKLIIKQLADGEYTVNGKTMRQKLDFPVYKTGQTYLFFLPEPHSVTGLLAPIGLFQGVFKIETDSHTGKESIPALTKRAGLLSAGLSGANNSFLSKQLNAASVGSDTSYDTFKATIQTIIK